MFFRQYYLQCLSHASYLVGDRSTGKAVVVDPQRDVEQYLADAQAEGLTITSVFETHFHADFLSGHLELAAQVGAEIVYGAGAAGRVDFPIRTMKDGEHFSLGQIDLELLETPGHTPESACLIIRPEGPNGEPYGVCTGDTLFIGDVGRPDLLSAVGFSADDLARQLYESLHGKLMKLPDATKVYPAHGAGSSCGKNLSTETVSTIGEQRRTNYALASMSMENFVESVTQGQSVAPLYFLFAANKNRQTHKLYEDNDIKMLTLEQVIKARSDGAVIIDSRDDMSFAAGHLRNSVNVGLSGRFAEYVGEVMEPGTPIVLVSDPGTETEAKMRLARIGFDNVIGALNNPVQVFFENPESVEQQSRLSVEAFNDRIASVKNLALVDIRNIGEVELGSIPGARHISLPSLLKRMDELNKTSPIVVFCAGGYRSSIASSLLKSHGFTDVSDLIGGYSAWIA
jgi:glyoxylase-like metal-dependent hydrolase (beta-lactamase superfamily II)/rhodanese-related sulfurtransferase